MSETQNVYAPSRSKGIDLSDDNEANPDSRWWRTEDSDDAARSMVALLDSMKTSQEAQEALNLRNLRLYGNRQYLGFAPGAYNKTPAIETARDERLRLNVCRSVVDSATAKVAKNRPKPMFLTDGGTWLERRKTKKLDQFVDGLFAECRVNEAAPGVFRDAGIFGTAAIKVFAKDGRPAIQKTFPSELFVDDADGARGNPRTLYQVWWVDKESLIHEFAKGDDAEAIRARINASDDDNSAGGWGRDPTAQQVRVIEAWHLPSSKKAKDGRHVIAVRGGHLLDRPWTRKRFPFAFFRWSEAVIGFWGTGIVQEITPIQLEINYCLQKLQKILTLHAQPMIFVASGSKLALTKVATNALGSVHETVNPEGMKFFQPPPLGGDLREQVADLVQRAYQNTGVSEMSSQSLKPAGLDSGAALRAYDDIETGRFAIAARAYEQFHLDLAELLLDEVRELDDAGKFEVFAPEKGALSAIRWGDVAITEGKYLLKCFPSSSLPSQPSGRIAYVQELMKAGLFKDPRDGLKLIDFPDLQSYADRAFAAQDVIDAQIERILEGEAAESPEPTFDIDYAFRRSLEELALGTIQEMPEARREQLRRYSTTAQQLIKLRDGAAKLAPAAPSAPMPTEMQPTMPTLPMQAALH